MLHFKQADGFYTVGRLNERGITLPCLGAPHQSRLEACSRTFETSRSSTLPPGRRTFCSITLTSAGSKRMGRRSSPHQARV